jgi:hypothetical protein
VDQEVGDLLEFAVLGDVEDVVAAIVEVVSRAPDGAERGVAGGDAGQGDGFLGLRREGGGGRGGLWHGLFSLAWLYLDFRNSASSFCS